MKSSLDSLLVRPRPESLGRGSCDEKDIKVGWRKHLSQQNAGLEESWSLSRASTKV